MVKHFDVAINILASLAASAFNINPGRGWNVHVPKCVAYF